MSFKRIDDYTPTQLQNEIAFLNAELNDARSLANGLLIVGGIIWNCLAILLAYDLTGSDKVLPGIITVINFAIVFKVHTSVEDEAFRRRCRHLEQNDG